MACRQFVTAGMSTASPRHLQRVVLTTFIVTFACARILVLPIVSRDIPDLHDQLCAIDSGLPIA